MTDFQMPNIPNDKISPLKPDLKWLWITLAILLALTIFIYIFFSLFSYYVISKIDLEKEKKYFWSSFINQDFKKLELEKIWYNGKIPDYIDIYVIKSDEINAFATIWWNIIFTTWILNQFEYQEEFLFVLWHEITHIENRDVIKSFSTQIPFYITMVYLWMDIWFDYSQIINLSTSYISRETELKADKWWINFVKKQLWNNHCILNFFQDKENLYEKYLFFSSTHPTTKARITQIQSYSDWKNNDFSKCKKFIYENK